MSGAESALERAMLEAIAADAEVKALCKVVYAVFCSSNRKFRIGLQFLKFEAGGEATLKKFIEDKLG